MVITLAFAVAFEFAKLIHLVSELFTCACWTPLKAMVYWNCGVDEIGTCQVTFVALFPVTLNVIAGSVGADGVTTKKEPY